MAQICRLLQSCFHWVFTLHHWAVQISVFAGIPLVVFKNRALQWLWKLFMTHWLMLLQISQDSVTNCFFFLFTKTPIIERQSERKYVYFDKISGGFCMAQCNPGTALNSVIKALWNRIGCASSHKDIPFSKDRFFKWTNLIPRISKSTSPLDSQTTQSVWRTFSTMR